MTAPPRPRAAATLWGLAVISLAACHSPEARLGVRAFFQDSADDAPDPRARVAPAPAPPLALRADDWPDFRGRGRTGRTGAAGIDLRRIGSAASVAWRAPLGPAYSSAVSGHGLVFTAEQRRDEEALVALDLESGREVWSHGWVARFSETLSKVGPRTTPVLTADGLVFLGATGELRVLDARTGDLRWRTDVLADAGARNLDYGLAATPLVLGDLLIVTAGEPGTASGGGMVLAYDAGTGAIRWRAVDEKMTYSSPVRVQRRGATTVVVVSAKRVIGLDPVDGSVRWDHPWPVRDGNSCTMPRALGDGSIVLSAGYGTGAVRLRIVVDGTAARAETVWRTRRFKTRFNDLVLDGSVAYGLDEGVLACLDLATGDRRWREGRYGYGQLLGVPGGLVVTTDEGELLHVAVGPAGPEERARVRLLEGVTLTPPIIARGRLLLRGRRELVCVDLRPGPTVEGA